METGNDEGYACEGYAVPIQLHPHTDDLAALVMPDARALGAYDQRQGRNHEQLAQDAIHLEHGSRERVVPSRYGVWVSPPALQSLREQAKQLQQQKRAKQRQHMILDANLERFEQYHDFQRHEQQGAGCPNRSYQLIGASTDTVSTPYRRGRDGGVLVPLRMMASLAIMDADRGGAGAAVAAPADLGRDQAGPGSDRQLHGMRHNLAADGGAFAELLPATASPVLATAAPVRLIISDAEDADGQLLGATWREQQQAAVHRPGPQGQFPRPGLRRKSTPLHSPTANVLGSDPLSAEHARIDFLSQREPSRRQQPQHLFGHHRQQQQRQSQKHQQQQELQLNGLEDFGASGYGAAVQTCGISTEDEDDGDGSMLIDVGSADRAAEGALLPTPERPRAAAAATGWDALRGLGFQTGPDGPPGAEASAGGGGGVSGTLALLSATSLHDSDGTRLCTPTSPHHAQQLLYMASAPVLDGAGQARQPYGGRASGHQALRARLAPREAAGGDGDEGFDADDEGEAALREERARAAFRLGGRSAKFGPLPGLTHAPPWCALAAPAPASASSAADPLGLASLAAFAMALPGGFSAAESADLLHRRSQSSHLAGLDVDADSSATLAAGVGPGADPDPGLAELMKLKCSLRRAVQGHNVQAMGLILSLLAALPATPGLLADSQVAALVSPLQQYGNAQVAAAARHLMVVWKGVLKAAARRTTSIGGNPGSGPGVIPPTGALGDPAVGSRGPGLAFQRVPSGHQHNHTHTGQGQWHQRPLLPAIASGAAPAATRRHDSRDWDVPVRDQAAGTGQRVQELQVSGAQGRMEPPPERHLRGLSLARSQSDALVEGVAVVPGLGGGLVSQADALPRSTPQPSLLTAAGVGGVAAAGDASRRAGPGVEPQRETAQPLSRAPLAPEGLGGHDVPYRGWEEGFGGVGRRINAGLDSCPSGSRTQTEAEAESRSSGEDTIDEGVACSVPASGGGAIPAGDAGDSGAHTHGRHERCGGGGGNGPAAGATTSCSPLPPSQANAPRAGGGGSAERPLRVDAGAAGPVGAAGQAPCAVLLSSSTPAPLSSRGEGCSPPGGTPGVKGAAAYGCPGGLVPAAEASLGGGDGLSGRDHGDNPLVPALPAAWRHGLVVPGCVPATEDAFNGPDGLPLPGPLRPLSSVAMAVGPTTPAAVLMVPPPLSQPSGRKRKGDRERPGSRRRSGNPSKRVASSVAAFPGPRPLHSTIPLAFSADAAGCSLSDDQRLQPTPHGPVTGLKTPARSNLRGLHAPLSKRQRHHAGSSAGQHGGGSGHYTATQVRRMSLLLSSLDLGGGSEGAVEQAMAPMEGDVDADADMGSQDDEAVLMASDEDLVPYSYGAGAAGLEDAAAGGVRSTGTSSGMYRVDGRKLSPPPPPPPLPPERNGNAVTGQQATGGTGKNAEGRGGDGDVFGIGAAGQADPVISPPLLAGSSGTLPAARTPVLGAPPLRDPESAVRAHVRHDLPAGNQAVIGSNGGAEGAPARGGSRAGGAVPTSAGAAPAPTRWAQLVPGPPSGQVFAPKDGSLMVPITIGDTTASSCTSTGATAGAEAGDAGRLAPVLTI